MSIMVQEFFISSGQPHLGACFPIISNMDWYGCWVKTCHDQNTCLFCMPTILCLCSVLDVDECKWSFLLLRLGSTDLNMAGDWRFESVVWFRGGNFPPIFDAFKMTKAMIDPWPNPRNFQWKAEVWDGLNPEMSWDLLWPFHFSLWQLKFAALGMDALKFAANYLWKILSSVYQTRVAMNQWTVDLV